MAGFVAGQDSASVRILPNWVPTAHLAWKEKKWETTDVCILEIMNSFSNKETKHFRLVLQ